MRDPLALTFWLFLGVVALWFAGSWAYIGHLPWE